MKKNIESILRVLFLFVYIFSAVPPQAASAAPAPSAPAIVESSAAPGPVPAKAGSVMANVADFKSVKSSLEIAQQLRLLGYSIPGYGVSGTQNGLTIEPIAAYNLIVDSNVLSPASYGPSAASVGAKFCNTNASDTLSNVWAYTGNYDTDYNGTLGDKTVGSFPRRFYDGIGVGANYYDEANFYDQHGDATPDTNILIGATATDHGASDTPFALELESGTASAANDGARFIGTLAPGECRTQYWLVSYPRTATIGASEVDVTGGIKPEDDLWLPYFFWGTSTRSSTTADSWRWNAVTMRNEISAQANKIWPNGDNKVPQQYLDAIQAVLGWDTITPSGTSTVYPGQTVTSQGIWYDLGNVGQGFDNNGDFVPDRNIWVQPIGDAGSYDPGCFRLVRTYGIVIVKLNDGTELLIPFADQMYFENIPSNNTGAVGLVYYEYAALDGACTANLTPYQEVASGYDNEKFNGDFGSGIPPLQSREADMTLTKSGDASEAPGGTIDYTLTFSLPDVTTSDTSTTLTIGNPGFGLPLVFEETIPDGLQFGTVNSTVTLTGGIYAPSTNVTAAMFYSVDSGASWSSTAPAAGTPSTGATDHLIKIQWWLPQTIQTPASGSPVTGQVAFTATVPVAYSSPVVVNEGCMKLGNGSCFTEDDFPTLMTGSRTLSGTVFLDNGVGGGGKANGSLDGTEGGIGSVTVNLYYDADANGVYSDGDVFYTSTTTAGNGTYSFSSLPATRFVVAVDLTDTDLNGYAITTADKLGVDLTGGNSTGNNFGFIPAPEITKSLPANVTALYRGQEITYTIAVTNPLPGSGTTSNACLYTAWATSEGSESSGEVIGKRFSNIYPATTAPNTSHAWSASGPDGAFVAADYSTGANQLLAGAGYSSLATFEAGATNITNLTVRLPLYINREFVNGDEDYGHVYIRRGTSNSASVSIPYTTLEQHVGQTHAGVVEVDITSAAQTLYGSALDFNFFSQPIQVVYGNDKSGSADPVIIAIDGIGLRVTADTADATCPVTDSKVLNPVTVTDVFDNTLLNATTITSVPPFTSKVPSAGNTTLTWDNIGPIYPGQTRYIYVTGTVLDPDPSPENLTNSAEITSAYFADGRLASDPGPVSVITPVYDAGTLSGKVWKDGDQDGWISTNGYETGEAGIEGVRVDLYQCISPIYGTPVTVAITGLKCTEYDIPGATEGNAVWGLVDSTYTNASGDYSFGGLTGYFYTYVQPATGPLTGLIQSADPNDKVGDCGSACDGLSNENINLNAAAFLGTVLSGNDVTNINFGYGTMGAYGYVFYDYDGDGTHVNTEDYSLEGVTVRIYRDTLTCTGTPFATTTTNGNGYYSFTGLTLAASKDTNYCIEVVTTTLPGSGWTTTPTYEPDGTYNSQYTFTLLKTGTTNFYGNYDFSYTKPFSYAIGDQVYYDWSGDGAFTSGVDELIPGVVVELYYDVDGDGNVDPEDNLVATDTTDATSGYLFENMPAGTYVVVIDSFPTAVGDDLAQTDDPDESGKCSTCDNQSDVTITNDNNPATNDNNYEQDFGYQPARFGTIGDTVFYDVNADGTQVGPQEVGIAGVKVELWVDLNNDNTYVKVDEKTTDSLGKYLFTNVPLFDSGDMDANTYQVRLYYENDAASPNETANRTAIEAYFDGDSNTDDLLTSLGTDQPTYVYWNAAVNTSSTSFLTADFGFGPLGKFGDTVYWDANNNGDQDYSESGVQNALVTLYTFTDAGNNNGSWNAGEGFLNEDGSVDAFGNPTYTAGEPFYDVPDGKYQPGEVIANTVYAVDVTDADGKYLFTGLPSGNYVAVVNTTSATIDHDQNSGTANIANPLYNANLTGDPDTDGIACDKLNSPADLYETDENFCDNRTGMQIFPGTNYMGADFGYLPSGVIGDRLWIDSDGDGKSDIGEAGIPEVDVNIYEWDDSVLGGGNNDGIPDPGELTLYETVETDVNGYYVFQNIPNGSYVVSVNTSDLEFPDNLLNIYDPDGSNNSQTVVILSGGVVTNLGGCATTPNGCDSETDALNLDADFGYQYGGTGALSGTICLETVVNGICGTGTGASNTTSGVDTSTEVAYSNVTVYLYRWDDLNNDNDIDSGETTQIASTQTSGGNYSFTGIPEGTYYIVAIGAPQPGLELTTTAADLPQVGDNPDEAVVESNPAGEDLSAYQIVQVPGAGDMSVENVDFAFTSTASGNADFGDLPQGLIDGKTYTYNTTLTGTPDGPRHLVPSTPNLYLGTGVTKDINGYPTSKLAAGESDTPNEGVTLNNSAWGGGSGSFTVAVKTPASGGWLVGWLDFNGDGDFGDAGEMVVSEYVPGNLSPLVDNPIDVEFSTPYNMTTNKPPVSGVYARFRLFPSEPAVPALAFSGEATNGEVEDYLFGGITTPVTVSYFRAVRQGSVVNFEWSTATETGNLGFNLYVESADGGLIQLNPELIPSLTFDSLDRQDYSFSLEVGGNTFYIEDVSLLGETRRHGPFQLGQKYGEQLEEDKIDQAAIAAEHKETSGRYQAELKKNLKVPAAALQAATGTQTTMQLTTSLNLKVNKTGIYRATYEMLRDAGLDLAGVPDNKITLTNRGQVVPIYVEGKGKFGPGAFIEFYGEALDTIYTDTNIYTLQVSKSLAARIQGNSAASGNGLVAPVSFAETLVVNNQRKYANYAPGSDAWYELGMTTKTLKTWSFPFQVNGVVSALPAGFELDIWGATRVDHHVQISLNGIPVADEIFAGLTTKNIKVTLPAGTLRDGNNILEITLPNDTGATSDSVVLDKYSISYQRSFQAQNGRLTFTAVGKVFSVINLPSSNVVVYRMDPKGITRLGQVKVQKAGSTFSASFAGTNQSATYLVTVVDGLYAPSLEPVRLDANLDRPAQYLIIAHPDFINGIQPLVQARQAQGLTVSVVDVNDLYAQYNYGIFDPQAIKKYIAYASQNLGTEYVLLIGGDTYDYRNYLGKNSISFIPSLYAETRENVKFVPVDPLYADLDEDNVPDLAIGRFPVRTSAQLDLMVNKTLAYAAKSYVRTSVFASDKRDASAAISFKTGSNKMVEGLPLDWSSQNIHLDDVSLSIARQQLLAAMNRGTALVTYTGHSGPAQWSFSNLFTSKDAAALTNAGRPFVTVQWGCYNTYYIDPINNYLVQSLLFSGDKGSVAALGAVYITEFESEELLGGLLVPRITTPGMPVGKALLDAKQELALSHPELLDVLLGFTLMGDPALIVEP